MLDGNYLNLAVKTHSHATTHVTAFHSSRTIHGHSEMLLNHANTRSGWCRIMINLTNPIIEQSRDPSTSLFQSLLRLKY